jgi:glyoxylase-like metal-dependent hydrolase (beta-lactamase superfamily II)
MEPVLKRSAIHKSDEERTFRIMTKHSIGDIIIHRVVESICADFVAMQFFPETTPEDWAHHGKWLAPWGYLPDTGNIILTIQAFLVRTRHHTILVDTCVGDDKPRPARPFWDMMKLNTFLPRLKGIGVTPDQVDYVMCTHMHPDHVGWNTRLHNGQWLPTFPKAKYLFTETEWQSTLALHERKPVAHFVDSVLPIMQAGQAQLVASDFALDDEVRLVPSPGHTMGHVCVQLNSKGQSAVITGDCIHSPVQCLEPDWVMRADIDSALAARTRRGFLERCCESKTIVCATHFPEPSFGHIVERNDTFSFEYFKQQR